MKELKKHLSLSEQVERLESRGLLIPDHEEAEKLLSHVNYYRLTGYLHGFKQTDGTGYRPGVSLDQIKALYDFDRKLTRLLMFALEDIEETLKTRLSYTLTSAFPEDPLIYLDRNLYRDQRAFLRFQCLFENELNNNRNLPFVKHHIEEYDGNLPMWVAVELFTMGNLSAVYENLKSPYQKSIARSFGTGPVQLKSWIENLKYTRNHLAHFMRVYDFNFGRTPVQCNKHHQYTVASGRIFDQIYIMSFLYSSPTEWNNYVLAELAALLENYSEYIEFSAIGFPDDWQKILTV